MSLPTQRPNYVLVWIGIVMLTFSMAGNWILDSSGQAATNLVDSTRSTLDYEDSAILPGASTSMQNLMATDALAKEDAFDQMIPLRQDESLVDGIPLAQHDQDYGPTVWQPFQMESVKEGPEPGKDSEQGIVTLRLAPEESALSQPEQDFHAFKPKRKLSRKQKAAAGWEQNGQYNSEWKGDHFGHASKSGKGGKGRGTRSILVKSSFTPKGPGRIAVRFFLGQEGNQERLQNRLELLQDGESARLAHLAEQYLNVLEEVLSEDQDDANGAAGRDSSKLRKQELGRLAQMKSKLRERLMQRPGGIELVAELSPSQLEALLQKLSAQNPKFRALVSS